MKLKNRILSMVIVILLAVNSVPTYALDDVPTEGAPTEDAAPSEAPTSSEEPASSDEPTPSEEPAQTKLQLNLTQNIGSWDTNKEYDGLAVSDFWFDKSILSGAEDGDEVYLVAKQKFNSKNASQRLRSVTLSNFRLEGEHKDKYEMPSIIEPIVKTAKILPRSIKIAPAKPYVYYGQNMPIKITDIKDYSDQIVEGDTVNISASWSIQCENNSTEYDISLEESSCNNSNYSVKNDNEVKFAIKEYKPDKVAIPDVETGKYVDAGTAVLEAPVNFLISSSNALEGNDWSESIEITLTEAQNGTGTATYYLRNNDESDAEFYRAISEQKIFDYECIKTMIEIESTKIEKVDATKTLNFLSSGVFSNGSVKITVTAKGTSVERETTIHLGAEGEEGDFRSEVATPKKIGEIYYYEAEFIFDLSNYMNGFDKNLKAYAENSLRTSDTVDINFLNNQEIKTDTKRLVLDNVEAEIVTKKIEGNYDGEEVKEVNVEVEISDAGSGIAKVEYKWDSEFMIDGESQSDYVEFKGTPTDKIYEFKICVGDFADRGENGKHNLYLRVTDNAGNICEINAMEGFDSTPPRIISVEVKKVDSVLGSLLRVLSFGNFSDKKVKITVFADDNEEIDGEIGDINASGVKSVSLNGKDMKKRGKNKYVLTIEPGYEIANMEITAIDNAGQPRTECINKIAGGTGLISNDLVVENDEPTIVWSFSSNGNCDDSNKVWYGKNDSSETVTIVTADQFGKANSGLHSIKIKDISTESDIVVLYKHDFTTFKENESKSFNIESFKDGYHKLMVEVEDNAGNKSSDEKEFYIDTVLPEGEITINSPERIKFDDKKWYDKNDAIEFRVSASDADSGLSKISIKINKNEEQSQSRTFSKDQIKSDEKGYYVLVDINEIASISDSIDEGSVSGEYVIKIEVTDNAGNIKEIEEKIYIDNISPQMDEIKFNSIQSNEVGEKKKLVDGDGFNLKTVSSATIYFYDEYPTSGIKEVEYRFEPSQNGAGQSKKDIDIKEGKRDGLEGTVKKVLSGEVDIPLPSSFKGQLYLKVTDNVGNSSEKTIKITIDNDAPKIEIKKNNTTAYHDANGNMLYTSDNSFTVTVTDETSGIGEIGYYKSSEKEPNRETKLNHKDSFENDGWTVVGDDVIVTKIIKTFSFDEDDNDVLLSFSATDNSKNQITGVQSEKFTIDKTAPIINAAFRNDSGSGAYYNANRVADITVIERNFDAGLIKTIIENKFGKAPAFTFEEKSKTEHTAVINFDEGDYTFDVNGVDLGSRTATVNFSGGNEKLFYVDKTKPAIEDNFASFINSSTDDSFNTDRTANIKVTEHNFDPNLTKLKIMRKGADENHTAIGLADATNELLGGAHWISTGDVHTISFTFSKDAVYQIEIVPSDLAGNSAEHRNTTVFEIDKTAPSLVKPADETAYIYVKPISSEPSETMVFSDNNIKEISYSVTAYDFSKKDDGVYEMVSEKGLAKQVKGANVDLPKEYFYKDGIYEMRATAYDIAGNDSGEKVHTYVAMRDTAMMAYIPEKNFRKFNNIGTRAIDFSDIPIYVYIANGLDFKIKIGETLLDEGDYTIIREKELVNQVREYQLSIPQIYISKMFSENNQVYDLPINVLNSNGQLLTLGRMVIDNVKPFGEFEEGFESGRGYYEVKTKDVQIIKLSDDIDANKTKVNINGKDVPFSYDADSKTITFTLTNSEAYGQPWAGHTIKATLIDMAGNEYAMSEIDNIYIGEWFMRFWIFFASGGGAIIIASALLFHKGLMIRRNK